MHDRPVKLVRKRLDANTLLAHLQDVAARASSIEVRVKGEGRMSEPTTEPLEALASRLAAGELAAVQIRFFADGAWWTDTLVRARDGFRLVRHAD